MKPDIWGMLTEHEGRWVALDGSGGILARAGSLPEVRRATAECVRRPTFLYAAAPAGPALTPGLDEKLGKGHTSSCAPVAASR